ncbi:MAG: hypothetical protein ACJAW7_001452 [Candidatus Azotimanducaceae bacterium]|jgi:hypothetical protein
MNSHNTPNWQDDDNQLQNDFADISALHQGSTTVNPEVPQDLSESVLRQARLHQAENMTTSWILSPAMLLALATLLLFVIGILYVVSLDHSAARQTELPSTADLTVNIHGAQDTLPARLFTCCSQ